MHPRISVSAICTYDWDLQTDLGFYAETGITNVGISAAKLDRHGWVDGVADNEVTFLAQAQDEQEQVCEASIRLAILQRARVAQRITRKREAIERRELYRAA